MIIETSWKVGDFLLTEDRTLWQATKEHAGALLWQTIGQSLHWSTADPASRSRHPVS